LADDDIRTAAQIVQPKFVVPGSDDVVMSSTASPPTVVVSPAERLEVLFEELAELAGQRNAIDGRIVEIVAEIDRDELCGMTGARSVAALVAWKLVTSSANAATIATVAHRLEKFPSCAQGMREGRLSLDQVGVIAARGWLHGATRTRSAMQFEAYRGTFADLGSVPGMRQLTAESVHSQRHCR
jgi:hypothetical protein